MECKDNASKLVNNLRLMAWTAYWHNNKETDCGSDWETMGLECEGCKHFNMCELDNKVLKVLSENNTD